eukprot:3968459-Alexandrium_andersonii.AAC.1
MNRLNHENNTPIAQDARTSPLHSLRFTRTVAPPPAGLRLSAPAVHHPDAVAPVAEALSRLEERPRGNVISRRVQ